MLKGGDGECGCSVVSAEERRTGVGGGETYKHHKAFGFSLVGTGRLVSKGA